MRAHDWFIEHRPDFVARALEPGDEALFRDHLGRCPECADAVAALADDLRWLPMGVTPVAPRPGFTHRVVSEVTRGRPPAWRRLGWPLLAAASLLLALGSWQAGRERVASLETALDLQADSLQAVRDTLGVLLRANRILQASIQMNGKTGGMLIFADDVTHRWKVVVHGIPGAPEGQRYTFWFITEDGMVHGAEVICDETNPAVLTLDMPPGARLIKGGSLTVEPASGDPAVPVGPELAHLEL